MAKYQIWADITQAGPENYVVTVSAVPAEERTEHRTGGVTSRRASSLEEANAIRDQLVLEAGKSLRSRGHVIVSRFDEEN